MTDWIARSKNCLYALALISSPSVLAAEPVPADLQHALKMFATTSISVDAGVVRVVLKKPLVSKDMARYVAINYCSVTHPPAKNPWGGQKLVRIEVVNDANAQGFAFAGGLSECRQVSQVPGDKAKAAINTGLWVCVAGNPCRPRRTGETTSGDAL